MTQATSSACGTNFRKQSDHYNDCNVAANIVLLSSAINLAASPGSSLSRNPCRLVNTYCRSAAHVWCCKPRQLLPCAASVLTCLLQDVNLLQMSGSCEVHSKADGQDAVGLQSIVKPLYNVAMYKIALISQQCLSSSFTGHTPGPGWRSCFQASVLITARLQELHL